MMQEQGQRKGWPRGNREDFQKEAVRKKGDQTSGTLNWERRGAELAILPKKIRKGRHEAGGGERGNGHKEKGTQNEKDSVFYRSVQMSPN